MSKSRKRKNERQNTKLNDKTRFISPETAQFDPSGSYTGVPNEVFYDNSLEQPIQDADDL